MSVSIVSQLSFNNMNILIIFLAGALQQLCMDHPKTYNSAVTFLCNLLPLSFSLVFPQAFFEFFLLQSIPISLTIQKDDKEFFQQLMKFDFLFGFVKYHVISNVFGLEIFCFCFLQHLPLCQILTNYILLSNC